MMMFNFLSSNIYIRIWKNRITAFKPNLVLHPLEMIEGGLSQVEGKVLRELGATFGSPKVIIHLGPELSGSDVMDKIKTIKVV